MAEVLTSMEPAEQPGELNAEEQNSLEVGEQLAQEQETLLAGKYDSTEQLEQAYLELQQKLGADEEGEPQEEEPGEEQDSYEEDDGEEVEGGLTDEDIEALQDMAGGEQQYEQMLGWASDNLSEAEIDMYDDVMDSGDPAACFFAVQALMARYGDSTGVDGELLTGKSPTTVAQGFRSQAELVQAMSDPRYESDPAYRSDVINKLENSEIDF
jgi:hypothetical protein|tara:strand:+ start:2992 stop:3627 length:636 start_codon:yes stop_codon:yes gene_type:complete